MLLRLTMTPWVIHWGENRYKSLSFDQLLENTRLEVFVQPIFRLTPGRFPAGRMGPF
jgi:hypothetical protein